MITLRLKKTSKLIGVFLVWLKQKIRGALWEGGGRVGVPAKSEVPEKVRKNALQIKKEAEEEEKEMLEKEKFWESPAFLRRKKII